MASPEDCRELLECARYGETEDLEALLKQGVPADFRDDYGNTALHKACANGHLDCARVLLAHGCPHAANDSGNLPLHWAVVAKAVEVVRLLLTKVPDIDVLAKNSFGRSPVSEAFDAQDADVLKLILEHKSAKALEEQGSASTTDETVEDEDTPAAADAAGGAAEAGPARAAAKSNIVQSHTHRMSFHAPGAPDVELAVRELGTDWAGDVFDGQGKHDTTGIQIWATSLVFARWIVEMRHLFAGKRVAELGAGCGLPGMAAAAYTPAASVLLTDVFKHSLDNLRHNVDENKSRFGKCAVSVAELDWSDKSTYPEAGSFDVVLGCDLVYDSGVVDILVATVMHLLAENSTFLYVCGEHRLGTEELFAALEAAGLKRGRVVDPVPAEPYKTNPLVGGSDAELALHFNELEEAKQMFVEFTRGSGALDDRSREAKRRELEALVQQHRKGQTDS